MLAANALSPSPWLPSDDTGFSVRLLLKLNRSPSGSSGVLHSVGLLPTLVGHLFFFKFGHVGRIGHCDYEHAIMSKIIIWIKKETVEVEAMETKLLQTRNELSASTLSSVSVYLSPPPIGYSYTSISRSRLIESPALKLYNSSVTTHSIINAPIK